MGGGGNMDTFSKCLKWEIGWERVRKQAVNSDHTIPTFNDSKGEVF